MIESNTVKFSEKNSNNNDFEDLTLNAQGFTKEQILVKNLKTLAKEYIKLEKLKNEFASLILRNISELDFSELITYKKFYIKESSVKKTVSPSCINGLNIVSVDGSSVVKNFMNVDFSFLKAISVKYTFYNKGKSAKIEYYPDINGFNNYAIQGNYLNKEEYVVENKVSLDMAFMEINLLNNLIKKTNNIDLIIIDGSVLPTPINLLFSQDFEISVQYDKLLKEYEKLYSNCKEYNIVLIGSIKDTRTSALSHLIKDAIQLLKPSNTRLTDFIKINYRELFNYFSDLDLFNRLLKKFERSCVFNCKQNIDKIRDTGIKKEIPYYFPLSFYAFYLKTAQYDIPCRIEFFTNEEDSYQVASKKADLISSLILPISSLNEHYGLPIPQIEAHKRAVFNQRETDLLFNTLKRTLNQNGIVLLEKRRNRRPF